MFGFKLEYISPDSVSTDPDTLKRVTDAYGDKAIHAQFQLKASESGDEIVEKLSKTEAKKVKGLKFNQAVLELVCTHNC